MEKLPHYNFSWTVSLQKNMRDSSSGDTLKTALFGKLSLEEAMDLSRDRQILELSLYLCHFQVKNISYKVLKITGTDGLT
jgi:hypothetical protein